MSPIYIGKIIKTSQTYNGWKNNGVRDLYSGIYKTAEEEDDCKNQVMSNEHEHTGIVQCTHTDTFSLNKFKLFAL